MNKYIFIALAVLLLGCNSNKKAPKENKPVINGDTITIPSNSSLLTRIEIITIKEEPFKKNISTFGIVQAIPNQYAEIASPFPGRIIKSFVKLGQNVKKDDPVFAISSPDIFEAEKIYYQIKQELILAEKNLKRQQDLYKNGVGVQKDLEEAEVNYEVTKRDYENVIASLKVYKVNPDKLVLGQPLIIRTPIAGDIVENKIVLGQYLKEDAEPVVIVAELSKVWIVGQVKEKDINSIHESEDIEITASSVSENKIKGKIYYISDLLDEETRSVQVFIECDNSDHILKPGMYVSVSFIDNMKKKIVVPSTSVFQDKTGEYVFISEHGNKFIRRSVNATGVEDDMMLINSGIEPGESIVVNGGFFLLEQN